MLTVPRYAEEKAIPTAAPVANTAPAPLTVAAVYNHVYFYSNVNTDRCLDLMRTLRELDQMLRTERLTHSLPDEFPPTPIWLHVPSPGGDLFSGLNMIDQLKSIQTPIYSIVEGYSASAATLISMPVTKRYIRKNSFMLVHQFTSFVWGTYEQFKDDMKLQDKLIEKLADFYIKHSKLKNKEIPKMLKHDFWMDAEEALKLGFVDAII